MPRYILKQYNRRTSTSTVGTPVAEWTLEAADTKAAITASEIQLEESGFRLPEDFAILRDELVGLVWDRMVHA
jgi:hypothetical protein